MHWCNRWKKFIPDLFVGTLVFDQIFCVFDPVMWGMIKIHLRESRANGKVEAFLNQIFFLVSLFEK